MTLLLNVFAVIGVLFGGYLVVRIMELTSTRVRTGTWPLTETELQLQAAKAELTLLRSELARKQDEFDSLADRLMSLLKPGE